MLGRQRASVALFYAMCPRLLGLVSIGLLFFSQFTMLNRCWRRWSLSVNEMILIGSLAQCTRRDMEVRKVNKRLKSYIHVRGREIKTNLLHEVRLFFLPFITVYIIVRQHTVYMLCFWTLGCVVNVLTGKLASWIHSVCLPVSLFEWQIQTITTWYRYQIVHTKLSIGCSLCNVFSATFWLKHRRRKATQQSAFVDASSLMLVWCVWAFRRHKTMVEDFMSKWKAIGPYQCFCRYIF